MSRSLVALLVVLVFATIVILPGAMAAVTPAPTHPGTHETVAKTPQQHMAAAEHSKKMAAYHKGMAKHHLSMAAEHKKLGHTKLAEHHKQIAKHHAALSKEHEAMANTHIAHAKAKK